MFYVLSETYYSDMFDSSVSSVVMISKDYEHVLAVKDELEQAEKERHAEYVKLIHKWEDACNKWEDHLRKTKEDPWEYDDKEEKEFFEKFGLDYMDNPNYLDVEFTYEVEVCDDGTSDGEFISKEVRKIINERHDKAVK